MTGTPTLSWELPLLEPGYNALDGAGAATVVTVKHQDGAGTNDGVVPGNRQHRPGAKCLVTSAKINASCIIRTRQ